MSMNPMMKETTTRDEKSVRSEGKDDLIDVEVES